MKKATVAFLLALFICLGFVACQKPEPTEQIKNYPVAGIWHAQESWHEDNPYNYGGDTYTIDVYFDFLEDGTLRNRSTLTLNGRLLSDSDWIIVNLTWKIQGNIITLSSGKQFIIVDDEFNDIWPSPKLTLHFTKETEKTGE